MPRLWFRASGSLAACVCVAGLATGCGGSSDDAAKSGPSEADRATIATVLDSARTDFAAVHNRDYAQPAAWFARAGAAITEPLRHRLQLESVYPEDFPRSGRTSVEVTRTALVSLTPKSAYVIVAAKQTSTSKEIGDNGPVAYTVALNRVGGKWLMSVDGASGIPDFDQSFASDAERAATRAAGPAYEAVLGVGSSMFDTRFADAAASLTGTAKTGYLATKTTLKAQLARGKVLSLEPRADAVGVVGPGSASMTLLITWSATVRLVGGASTDKFGVTELSMSKVGGAWLIAGMRIIR